MKILALVFPLLLVGPAAFAQSTDTAKPSDAVQSANSTRLPTALQLQDAANQGVVMQRPTGAMANPALASTMDNVFGAGAWREASGDQPKADEDPLRAQEADPASPGELAHHAIGTPDAPAAYDFIVDGMPIQSAVDKLKSGSDDFEKVIVEMSPDGQWNRLHVVPKAGRLAPPKPEEPNTDDIYLRVVNGQRNPALVRPASQP